MSASKPTTGRKPSSKPNIQSLPIRTPEGTRVRAAFANAGREPPAAPRGPKYEPVFKGPIEGWVVNFLTKNAWRVARTMEFDDCLQEAHLVFLRVARTYPEVHDAPHFMALFQTSWSRRFNDLSNEDTSIRSAEVPMVAERHDGDGEMVFDYVGEVQNDGELQVMLRQAPREVTMVLNLMLKAPQELLDLALSSWRGKDRRMKGGGSERINELLGLPAHYDVMQRVEDYFRHGAH